jgi:hypothetical protein
MVDAGGALTRSRIEAFDRVAVALAESARRWRASVATLEQVVEAYVSQINAPNGTEWEGQTATSYFQDAHADRLLVYPALDHGSSMAGVAEEGSSALLGARQMALEAIIQAELEDFTVAEDLSVSDNYVWESPVDRDARQKAALAHRNYIAHCAARLQAENVRIGRQLSAGAAELTAMIPAHWRNPRTTFDTPAPVDSGADTRASERNGKVHAVDNTFKRDGGPEPQPPADDVPADAAHRYDQTRRAADQALVDQATAEGRTRYVPGLEGQPGYLTREQHEAAGRLRDYKAINGPAGGDSDAQKLAGQRLEDYTMSTFVGPLPTDTVLGGDARTRAQARLDLQRALENGTAPVPLPLQYMAPDQATQLVNRAEAQGRTNVLGRLHDGLVEAGLSPGSADQVVSQIRNGAALSDVMRDTAEGVSTNIGALSEGAKAHANALPTGQHWHGPVWSEADVAALKRFGTKIGWAGTVIDAWIAYSDWQHGEPLGDAATKFGGSTLGSAGLGWAGGALWGSFVGPEGTLIAGFLGAIAGGVGGEMISDRILGH